MNEFLNSLKNSVRECNKPFQHWEINKPLTQNIINEIISVKIPQRKADSIVFNHDEFIKSKTTVSDLSKLKSVFKADGTVTAGNSSGLNDAA